MLRDDERYSEADALAKELEYGSPVFGTRDAHEGVKAFAEKRAGRTRFLPRVESISVPWEYRNPGKLVADALGCPGAKIILAGLGVLQLQLLSDLCNAIAAGERGVGVVTAGEAKYRRLRIVRGDAYEGGLGQRPCVKARRSPPPGSVARSMRRRRRLRGGCCCPCPVGSSSSRRFCCGSAQSSRCAASVSATAGST
jgi:hypothetical protein